MSSDRRAPSGWAQVVLAAVVMLATLPGRTQGLGLITEPLLADLRLSRVTYADLNLWATLAGALFCFPAGWAIDRFGLRWVTALLCLALGLVVWRLSAFAGSVTVLFVLLLATRALGQSALSVCSIATVGKWFPNRVGLPMAVYSVLLSVLFASAFGAIGYSVRESGWRNAWLQIALSLMFVITPLMALLLREPANTTATAPHLESSSGAHNFTLTQALQLPLFWVFAVAGAAFNLVSSGLGLFNEAVLAERGFDQETFHTFLVVTTLLSLVGQFACGWLSRWWKYQTLTLIALGLYAVSLAAIPTISTAWHLWPVAGIMGVAGGMIIVIFFSIWSEVFGRRHLGRIQGAAQMLTVISSGLGPIAFAKSFEMNRSYTPLLYSLAAAAILLAIVAAFMRLPAPVKAQSGPAGI